MRAFIYTLLFAIPACTPDTTADDDDVPVTQLAIQSTAVTRIASAIVTDCGPDYFSLPPEEWAPESPPLTEVVVFLCEEYRMDDPDMLVIAADACLHSEWRTHGGFDPADCPDLKPCLADNGVVLPDPWPSESYNVPSSLCYIPNGEEPD